ncbi:MAG: protein phosphatase 2C domain-containing protein [Oscillatoriales cyanobacterium C42_A2020_001]|nr:protein phosphatase 2C domain-containing protein [Leptolyngbyaceae cyanobacterium C42_A2020_001]
MHSPEATLYCANSLCQAPNPANHRFCQQCRSPLPKRYLWAVGKEAASLQPGNLLGDRYWCKEGRVLLDTKPGLFPDAASDLPDVVEPYLRLVAYQLAVPQPYALVASNQKRSPDVLLLERAPIYLRSGTDDVSVLEGTLMPEVETVWQAGSGLRQLHWLWQIARLWEPLSHEQVVSSLLNPSLLRVEGGLVRLLELQGDARSTSPTLANLGDLWQRWIPATHASIADFFKQLCQQLKSGHIATAEHLVNVLEQAIEIAAQSDERQTQIATLTDQGPSRQRNEDACFPSSGSLLSFANNNDLVSGSSSPLVVVCDGIGGHEGGNIASNLAIATIQQRLQSVPRLMQFNPNALITELEQVALAANDVIAQRNDIEQRHERQRMGTTLVMALECGHELYITHVGDSRAYRVTSLGCHQITLDDDLATREVRLGYALYREALRQPSSGSLVQALGMNTSTMLHPTVERFILDEECIFLLCSDGLSDNDRVEEYWQTILLPVLEGKTDLAKAAQQLVAIANEQNGHDNVTVGLVYCRVSPNSAPPGAVPASLATDPSIEYSSTVLRSDAAASTLKTQNLKPPERSRPRLSSLWLGLLLIAGVGGLITYFLLGGFSFLTGEVANTPLPASPDPATVPVAPTISPLPSANTRTFTIGTRMLVNRSTPNGETVPISLLPSPASSPAPDVTRSTVPLGSVLEVISQRRDGLNQQWLGVKVCSLSQTATVDRPAAPQPNAQPGELGWVQEAAIAPFVTVNVSLTPAQLGACGNERKATSTETSPP